MGTSPAHRRRPGRPHRRSDREDAAGHLSERLLFTLPVAYQCVFKLGFQTGVDRVLVHSLAGSAFFGAYAAKVLIVKMKRYPVWVIPTAGGLLFTTLIVVVWYTSALWFFSLVGEGY